MGAVFGPVPSRRLGQSLGVDPLPFKTCNYNCPYCQLGRTTPVTNERKDFFPPEDLWVEVQAALASHQAGDIDYITFVGQGEPLLCASLGWLIRQVKTFTDIPVAVITNGSLFFMPEVREELCAADVVIPSLDAADEKTFRQMNRPWPKLRIADGIDGLVAFREIFHGQVWLEVMLIKGINDTERALLNIADALRRIRPEQVHLNVPIRPPAEAWVELPDDEGMLRAMTILGEVATLVMPTGDALRLAEGMPVIDAVIETIRRHPIQEAKVVDMLSRLSPDQVQATLVALETSGQARRHTYRGEVFWEYAGGTFGKTVRSHES